MKLLRRHTVFAAVMLPLLTGAAAAQTSPAAGEPAAGSARADGHGFDLDLDLLAGARGREVTGSRDKFQEYGTVDEGFLLEYLRARYQRPGSADFLDFQLRDATQDDESYRLGIGRQGRYRVSLSYDAIPHRYAAGRLIFSGVGSGRLRVSDVVQSQLQAAEALPAARNAAPFTPNPAVDANQRSIVAGTLDAANPVGFRQDRRRAGAVLEIALPRDAVFFARVNAEDRDGARVMGQGTYERVAQNVGGVHLADRFTVAGNDVAEPLNFRTLAVGAGAGVHKESWLLDLEYTLTRFRNSDEVLLWDNPFRITDAQATDAAGAVANNAFNRGRTATGYVGLTPDSLSHDVSASGAIDLPMHGRLAASASYGIITQDQAFQPYTYNTAIQASDATGPLGSAAFLRLPQSDLNGDVRTLAGTLSATVRPVHPLSLSAKYRVYRYEGKSDEIAFPGYAAFGDSFWRREKNDVTGGLDAPVANEVFDYWRHEAELGADFRVTRMLSFGVETGWEGWRYDHLRVDKLDEYFAGATVAVKPLRNASLKARYRFADRTNEGYLRGATASNPEARGLLNFNWADRRRHLVDARAQYAPTRMISLGVLGRFVDEEYGGKTDGPQGVVDDFRFGRTDVRAIGGSLDVTVTPVDRVSMFASYSREYRKEQLANAAKDDTPKSTLVDPATGAIIADNFSPVNYWNSNVKNTVDTVGVGAGIQLIPDRLVLDARYNFAFGDMDVDTFNPNPIVTGGTTATLDNAIANDWPTIKSRLHEVTADLSYRLTAHVRAGVRYLFQAYDLDDFAWENTDPYVAGRTPENTTRFLFADATYNRYEAHVGTLYVAGSF